MNAFTAREHTAYYARLPERELGFGLDLLAEVVASPALRRPRDRRRARGHPRGDPVGRGHAGGPGPPGPGRGAVPRPPARTRGARRPRLDRDHGTRRHRRVPRRPLPAGEPGGGRRRSARPRRRGRPARRVPRRRRAGGQARPRCRRPPDPTPLTVVHRPTEQAHMAIGWRAFGQDDPDRYALAIVNHVLGGGMSSRLFQEVREQRGLVYSIYSFSSLYADAGAITVYAGTAPSKVKRGAGADRRRDRPAARLGHHRPGAGGCARLPRGLLRPRPGGLGQPHGPHRQERGQPGRDRRRRRAPGAAEGGDHRRRSRACASGSSPGPARSPRSARSTSQPSADPSITLRHSAFGLAGARPSASAIGLRLLLRLAASQRRCLTSVRRP